MAARPSCDHSQQVRHDRALALRLHRLLLPHELMPSSTAAVPVPQRWLAVYVIVKHPGRAPYWMSVGEAFVFRDDSLNVRFDALPIDGQLHIRKPPDRLRCGQPVTESEGLGARGRSR